MEIIKVLSLSDEDVELLKKAGKLLRQIRTSLDSKEADVLNQDSLDLLVAIKNVSMSFGEDEVE